MQQCQFCGKPLPENASFCGNCGREQTSDPQDARLDATIIANRQPQAQDDEEERRRRMVPPFIPLTGGSTTGGVPSVQGTPQVNDVPGLQGTQPAGNMPAGNLGNAGGGSVGNAQPAPTSSFAQQTPPTPGTLKPSPQVEPGYHAPSTTPHPLHHERSQQHPHREHPQHPHHERSQHHQHPSPSEHSESHEQHPEHPQHSDHVSDSQHHLRLPHHEQPQISHPFQHSQTHIQQPEHSGRVKYPQQDARLPGHEQAQQIQHNPALKQQPVQSTYSRQDTQPSAFHSQASQQPSGVFAQMSPDAGDRFNEKWPPQAGQLSREPRWERDTNADRKTAPPAARRWLLIAIVALVILGGSFGVFALIHHAGPGSNLATAGSASADLTATAQNNDVTPVATCQGGTGSNGNLTLTGSVTGTMKLYQVCDYVLNGSQDYAGSSGGTLGGQLARFLFGVPTYKEPGTYPAWAFLQTGDAAWGCPKTITPSCVVSVTVNSDGVTGSITGTLYSPYNPSPSKEVKLTGNWSK